MSKPKTSFKFGSEEMALKDAVVEAVRAWADDQADRPMVRSMTSFEQDLWLRWRDLEAFRERGK